jgi:hypothetical protein
MSDAVPSSARRASTRCSKPTVKQAAINENAVAKVHTVTTLFAHSFASLDAIPGNAKVLFEMIALHVSPIAI